VSSIPYEDKRDFGDLTDYQDDNESNEDDSEFPLSGYNGNDAGESGDIDGR